MGSERRRAFPQVFFAENAPLSVWTTEALLSRNPGESIVSGRFLSFFLALGFFPVVSNSCRVLACFISAPKLYTPECLSALFADVSSAPRSESAAFFLSRAFRPLSLEAFVAPPRFFFVPLALAEVEAPATFFSACDASRLQCSPSHRSCW